MEGKEKPLPRGNVDEHCCGVFTEKDVEIDGELYDIEYEVMHWEKWSDLVMECPDKVKLNRRVAKQTIKRVNGKPVDWGNVAPGLGTHLLSFATKRFKSGGPKNSGGASET